VLQPATLKDAAVQAQIAAIGADAMIVAAYGLIIPAAVLAMPRHGCYNIHASLLPRWRGAAPIQRAMLAADAETGVTIMEVVPALDAGAMISRGAIPITERDTAQTLHDALADLGARLMVEAMARLEAEGALPATPQDESQVTYAAKLDKSEATLDWLQEAAQLSRRVRAFNPFPVAQTTLHDDTCRIWMAHAAAGDWPSADPGTVIGLDNGIQVRCGDGVLTVEELQMPGGKRLSAREFLAGHALTVGARFGA
jgi:methionyl-tRNA formyltransferase